MSDIVRGKLILVRVDNACALHYINHGTGRITELSDLAKSIRLLEVQQGIESVAVRVPGESNVTANGLSRMLVSAEFKDPHPDRSFRKRLLRNVEALVGRFLVDGMVSDDGHNAM